MEMEWSEVKSNEIANQIRNQRPILNKIERCQRIITNETHGILTKDRLTYGKKEEHTTIASNFITKSEVRYIDAWNIRSNFEKKEVAICNCFMHMTIQSCALPLEIYLCWHSLG